MGWVVTLVNCSCWGRWPDLPCGAGRDPGTSPATEVKKLYNPLWQAGNVKEDITCNMPDILSDSLTRI